MNPAARVLLECTRRAALALLLCPGLAAAQAQIEADRALLQREHQSERFSLQLWQSQSILKLPAEERQKAEASYLQQRQAQEQLHDAQQRQAATQSEDARAGSDQRFERERRAHELDRVIAPQRVRADQDARWAPTLEERPAPGVSWTPTLEKRRP
jgi:hypothetical protein